MLAVLEFSDYAIIALVVALFAGGSAAWANLQPNEAYRLRRLERKLDLIIKHLGIEYADPAAPERLSEEVRTLADDPATKIQAIKLHRQQTGLSLKEAKEAVEGYINGLI